jgi:hypothetical protein
MAQLTWQELLGTTATATVVSGKLQITFNLQDIPNTGIDPAIANPTNAAEKFIAGLMVSRSTITTTETDNNVVVTKGFAGIQLAQRNNITKYQQDFSVILYSTASNIPTNTDPDNV